MGYTPYEPVFWRLISPVRLSSKGMSVSRSYREQLPSGEFRYINVYGLPRPLTVQDAVWVATNRLIRRAWDAAHRVCKPGREGEHMPSNEALRAAARVIVLG